jgi:hypothetical protein
MSERSAAGLGWWTTRATLRSAHAVDHGADPERLLASGSFDWVGMVLRGQGMPPDEIRAVLTTADGELIHRHLELHLERLEERLLAQQGSLVAIERILTEAAARRCEPGARPPCPFSSLHAEATAMAEGPSSEHFDDRTAVSLQTPHDEIQGELELLVESPEPDERTFVDHGDQAGL